MKTNSVRGRVRRRIILPVIGAALAAIAMTAWAGYREAGQTPIVVRYRLQLATPLARPLHIVLMSDTHAGRPDMPPARLMSIVEQANALQPDLILLAGDYVKRAPFGLSEIPPEQAIAPLGRLRARLGVVAVLGNNDCQGHRGNMIAGLLERAGVRLLRNQALLLPGVAVLGTDDIIHCNGNMGPAKIDFARQLRQRGLKQWPGPVILLTHEPVMSRYAPPYADLAVAGHTHGGQMFPALTGPIVARGTRSPAVRGLMTVIAEKRRVPLIITSGVGTNNLPLRIGVPPEIVLLTLR